MKNHHLLLISLILGAGSGLFMHAHAELAFVAGLNQYLIAPLGQIFLRLIFMVVTPMVVSGLILGVHQLSRHHDLVRVARLTLSYTVLASAASVLLGIGLVDYFQPGAGVQQLLGNDAGSGLQGIRQSAAQAKSLVDTVLDIIPKNPFDAAAKALEGGMLSLMFFALLFGVALANIELGRSLRWVEIMEETYEASMLIVDRTMRLAPLAVFALVFQSTFKFGSEILLSLGYYVLVVVAGLLLQQTLIYSLLLRLFSRFKPWTFFRQCRDVYLYAFATASSNATLPRSLELAERELRLTPEISRFVLTLGSTANQNGTALFEGVTVLFLAQVYQVELSLIQQVQVVVMAILAGVGTAGVPGGSLPLIMILTQQVGIPAEGMGLILGVDRFLDMCRTALNVSGDLVIAALVDQSGDDPENARQKKAALRSRGEKKDKQPL